ncbi:MAG: type II toxin-antitoxin system RelE/ParE family toxin [Planctomycetes bacterium]|nr:type II toxin-antitoxin system RelE/ParE family toxin [Planctomycetota bacterium]
MAISVKITPEALEQAGRLDEPIYSRIQKAIERLENWPRVSGVKALRGRQAGHFRIRTGDYRIQFRLEGQSLIVEKIGHRDGFYKD